MHLILLFILAMTQIYSTSKLGKTIHESFNDTFVNSALNGDTEIWQAESIGNRKPAIFNNLPSVSQTELIFVALDESDYHQLTGDKTRSLRTYLKKLTKEHFTSSILTTSSRSVQKFVRQTVNLQTFSDEMFHLPQNIRGLSNTRAYWCLYEIVLQKYFSSDLRWNSQLVFTHQELIKYIMTRLLHFPNNFINQVELSPGSITTVFMTAKGNNWIKEIGSTSHLFFNV
ncbi:hypothetical protein SNEBB_009607 [Seison nebaliae]|nr:hypothetical protein SNEBB_009607 [Seison nebaliae]